MIETLEDKIKRRVEEISKFTLEDIGEKEYLIGQIIKHELQRLLRNG